MTVSPAKAVLTTASPVAPVGKRHQVPEMEHQRLSFKRGGAGAGRQYQLPVETVMGPSRSACAAALHPRGLPALPSALARRLVSQPAGSPAGAPPLALPSKTSAASAKSTLELRDRLRPSPERPARHLTSGGKASRRALEAAAWWSHARAGEGVYDRFRHRVMVARSTDRQGPGESVRRAQPRMAVNPNTVKLPGNRGVRERAKHLFGPGSRHSAIRKGRRRRWWWRATSM